MHSARLGSSAGTVDDADLVSNPICGRQPPSPQKSSLRSRHSTAGYDFSSSLSDEGYHTKCDDVALEMVNILCPATDCVLTISRKSNLSPGRRRLRATVRCDNLETSILLIIRSNEQENIHEPSMRSKWSACLPLPSLVN